MKKILVIEDEPEMRRNLLTILKLEKFQPIGAENGRVGLDAIKREKPDLILCDVMMPELDGHGVLTALREDSELSAIPFVFLTAKGEKEDLRSGMNLGADDYLTKPFHIEELIARLHAVTRRAGGSSQSILTVADLSLNLLTREVRRGAQPIELTTREFSLLEHLMRAPGRVLTRVEICERVWEYNFDPGTNLVDVYIQRIRKKVDGDFPEKLIETIRGVGYRMRPGT